MGDRQSLSVLFVCSVVKLGATGHGCAGPWMTIIFELPNLVMRGPLRRSVIRVPT